MPQEEEDRLARIAKEEAARAVEAERQRQQVCPLLLGIAFQSSLSSF